MCVGQRQAQGRTGRMPERGERAPDPIEGERIQHHIGVESEHPRPGIEVHRAFELTGGAVLILVIPWRYLWANYVAKPGDKWTLRRSGDEAATA